MVVARAAHVRALMKPRKKRPRAKGPVVTPTEVQRADEAPPHEPVDHSEPADPPRAEAYDIERNHVSREVGPDEPEVDRRLEH